MRSILTVVLTLLCIHAIAEERDSIAVAQRYALPELSVTSYRPLSQIGVMKSELDTLVLRDNIALSLGDVLTYGSGIFVKEQGRGALSTVSFRGTSASHTQVSWNSIPLNSPTLGFTDFSMIPSYFVDDAMLLHGSSSISESSGGLGGAVILATDLRRLPEGNKFTFVQGVGSYSTFDEFLKYTFRSEKWRSSTRFVASLGRNNFYFINNEKWELEYDDKGNISRQYHPREQNRNASYRDFHLLQELEYQPSPNHTWRLVAWGTHSWRQLPLLAVIFSNDRKLINDNTSNSIRAALSHRFQGADWTLESKLAHSTNRVAYDNGSEIPSLGRTSYTYRTRSLLHHTFLEERLKWFASPKWLIDASLKAGLQQAYTSDLQKLNLDDGTYGASLSNHRVEASAYLSAKYSPSDRLGIAPAIRLDLYGKKIAPIIPAIYLDYLLYKPANIYLKASVSRNYHHPTLNDLYYFPGGNPDLRPEQGFSYDIGATFDYATPDWKLGGGVNWFDSHIKDWIIWLPASGTTSIWTPLNLHKVHAYGVEANLQGAYRFNELTQVDFQTNFAWTPSINKGPQLHPRDQSVGKQLVYVPKISLSAIARITHDTWRMTYKLAHYSKRYTLTSNQVTPAGVVSPYYMSDISIEKLIKLRPIDLSVKLAVKNLFNHKYQTVIGYPMPGTNFELFITIEY